MSSIVTSCCMLLLQLLSSRFEKKKKKGENNEETLKSVLDNKSERKTVRNERMGIGVVSRLTVVSV